MVGECAPGQWLLAVVVAPPLVGLPQLWHPHREGPRGWAGRGVALFVHEPADRVDVGRVLLGRLPDHCRLIQATAGVVGCALHDPCEHRGTVLCDEFLREPVDSFGGWHGVGEGDDADAPPEPITAGQDGWPEVAHQP